MGPPSAERLFVFNGDFVDRGAWGMETLILLCCWKLALPGQVFLLRGNHESATCSIMYGFKGELEAKYGKSAYKPAYSACKKMFAALPLAALVNRCSLVLHGGLFRRQPQRASGKTKRKRELRCRCRCLLGFTMCSLARTAHFHSFHFPSSVQRWRPTACWAAWRTCARLSVVRC